MYNLKKYKQAQQDPFSDFAHSFEDKRMYESHDELAFQILPWKDRLTKKIDRPDDYVYHEGYYYPIDEIKEGDGIVEEQEGNSIIINYIENGFILGLVMIKEHNGSYCLDSIAVVPWARGQGIGTKLYMEVGKYIDLSDPNSTCDQISDSALRARYNAHRQLGFSEKREKDNYETQT